MEPIILASSSLRRQEILKRLEIPFKVVIPDYDESLALSTQTHMEPVELVSFLASKKVESVLKILSQQTVPWALGADTLITLDGKFYGKPQDAEEATQFLHDFSGKTQYVISAISLYSGKTNTLDSKVSVNEVCFMQLSESEIKQYIATNEWQGVAGGYRIQEKAECFISHIKGSFSSIVGLPIFELYEILKKYGYSFFSES